MTKELLEEERSVAAGKKGEAVSWKAGDKVMAIWRVDGKYYSATINQILDDGTCTVIFDGYSSVELTQVGQLKVRTKNSTTLSNESTNPNKMANQSGNKKPFTKFVVSEI